MPFGHSFWTWNARTTVIFPMAPLRINPAASWHIGDDMR